MQKVSSWLRQHVESHAIQNHTALAAAFVQDTGHAVPWHGHTVAQARRAIAGRGLGGHVSGPDVELVCYGYEVAASCAQQFAGFVSTKMGRGSLFWDCIDALEKAGQ